jgi:hypothetical protein
VIEGLRSTFAWRAARAAAAARAPRPLPGRPANRRVLLLLPDDEPGQRATWDLVSALDLVDRQVAPVVLAERILYAPDRFAGAVVVIDGAARDWRRLPRRDVARAVWGWKPHVALSLADPDDLGAAYLAGASPAAVRVGRHRGEHEPFFDVMVAGTDDAAEAAGALHRLLAQFDPPVLPLR